MKKYKLLDYKFDVVGEYEVNHIDELSEKCGKLTDEDYEEFYVIECGDEALPSAIMFVNDKPEENFVDCVEYDYAYKYACHYLDKQLSHDEFDAYYELHQDIIDRPWIVNIAD